MSNPPLTDDEYVAKAGQFCPYCHKGPDNIEAGDAELDGDIAMVPVDCYNCGASYRDLYVLSGYMPTPEYADQLKKMAAEPTPDVQPASAPPV